MAEGLTVKPIPSITWTEVGGREAALIQRCAAHDEDACAELVAEHQRMVYQLAYHLLGDRQEALDLSQDVFLRVFRLLPQFRGQSTLKTWIYRIVVTQASNRQRSNCGTAPSRPSADRRAIGLESPSSPPPAARRPLGHRRGG